MSPTLQVSDHPKAFNALWGTAATIAIKKALPLCGANTHLRSLLISQFSPYRHPITKTGAYKYWQRYIKYTISAPGIMRKYWVLYSSCRYVLLPSNNDTAGAVCTHHLPPYMTTQWNRWTYNDRFCLKLSITKSTDMHIPAHGDHNGLHIKSPCTSKGMAKKHLCLYFLAV